ncbi:MAG: response regulator [Campylobacterota bacterium]|nr:response regulator [Campylobacterota bacterium]
MVKVLVVDDANLMHKLIKGMLSSRDVKIEDALDGEQAIEMAKKEKPDVVFLDVVMPKKDGIETLKELKEIYPDIKVIMASSMGTKDKIVESLKIGAMGFLQKPFEEDSFLEKFDEVLKR